jgi:hypothetical protein
MVDQYRTWFGANGTVLYPSRGDDSPAVRVRVRCETHGHPVVAFCGYIHLDGTAELLRQLAGVLSPRGGYLDLYTRTTREHLAVLGLDLPNVRVCGFFPAAEMGERVGRTAHALFLPASFDPRERIDVSTLFPSKLADYTAIGLPVLVWGPEYSSAVRWSINNPGATVCVTNADPMAVGSAVARLSADPAHAAAVAARGIEAGAACFAPDSARDTLYAALRGAAGPGAPAAHRWHPDRAMTPSQS